jgi:hypothetical protein
MAFRKVPPRVVEEEGSESETTDSEDDSDSASASPQQQLAAAAAHAGGSSDDGTEEEEEEEEEESEGSDEEEELSEGELLPAARGAPRPPAGRPATPAEVSSELVELALEVVDGDDVSPVVRLAFERAAPQARKTRNAARVRRCRC